MSEWLRMIGVVLHAGSMFWILQPATHNDYDGYSIYTDPARYPHDPKPIQPIPSPTVCSGGNATDVRPSIPLCMRRCPVLDYHAEESSGITGMHACFIML